MTKASFSDEDLERIFQEIMSDVVSNWDGNLDEVVLLDSLHIMELAFAIEDKLGLELHDGMMKTVRTPREFVAWIKVEMEKVQS